MPEIITRTVEFVSVFCLPGFVSVMALAVVAPYLGTFLVLRRMPMLGLAIPQMAGCGQAAAFFVFARYLAGGGSEAPGDPSELLQVAGSAVAVLVGLLLLVTSFGSQAFLGVYAAILFLAALGLQEVLFLESPYHEAFDEALHHGRVFTVLEGGMRRVVITCGVLLILAIPLRRPLWASAFDPDQARLVGDSPTLYLLVTLGLLGTLSALCVQVVGPEVVLSLLIIPPALVRGASPSLAVYGPLASLAGALGVATSFVLAVAFDWHASPAVILGVIASSVVVAAIARLVGWVVGRAPAAPTLARPSG